MKDDKARPKIITPPKMPPWITYLGLGSQVIIFGFILSSFGMAYPKGALSNLIVMFSMTAIVIVFLSRLWAVLTGNIVWKFWVKNISGKPNTWMRYWAPVLIRVVFYGSCLVILHMGIIPKQFPTAMAHTISSISYFLIFGLIFLSLLPKYTENWVYVAFCMVTSLGFGTVIALTLRAPKITDSAIIGPAFKIESLAFHAGSTPLVNYHTEYSNQANALDIIIYNPEKGTLSEGASLTEDPCFGAVLISPVNGRVAYAIGNRPDNKIGQTDRDMPVGNHISIDIEDKGEAFVLLAHLKQNSLQVGEGKLVRRGQPVAQCGNSGNTSGPHLHIQVQDKPHFDSKNLSTRPIYFDGITRVRNGNKASGRPLYIRRNDIIQNDELNEN